MLRGCCLLFAVSLVPCFAQNYTPDVISGTGSPGFGGDGSPAFRAILNEPASVALDASGRLYIADTRNNRVRRIELDGRIRTVAGNGQPGNIGDGGPAEAASLDVADIAVDPSGLLYIVGGAYLRAVSNEGLIWTVAGADAGLTNPTSVAVEQSGTVIVADGSRLFRIRVDGSAAEIATGITAPIADVVVRADRTILFATGDRIYTLAPDGRVAPLAVDGPVDSSTRLALDSGGQLYFSGASVSTVAGGQTWVLGSGGAGIALDPLGNIYVADPAGHRIRVLNRPFPGSISALIPRWRATETWPRDLVLLWSPIRNATSYDVFFGTSPETMTRLTTTAENQYSLPVLEQHTTYYWRVTTRVLPYPEIVSPTFSFTTATLTGLPPAVPSNPSPYNLSGGLPTNVVLTWNGGGAKRYDIYLGETENGQTLAGSALETRIPLRDLKPNTQYFWRVVAVNDRGQSGSAQWQFTTGSAGGFPWLIDTVAGRRLPEADGSFATEAPVRSPRSVASDPSGNVFFIEGGRRLMRLDAAAGKLTTVFTPTTGTLRGVATDTAGNVYAAQPEYVVRITRNGQRSIFAGQPGGADFNGISSIAADRQGRLYIADTGNHRVRSVTSAGQVRTLAGNGTCGDICAPTEVATDAAGNVYVYGSGRVLRIRPDETTELVTSAPSVGGLATDAAGNLYLADTESMTIKRVTASGTLETWAGEPDQDGRAFGFFGDGLPAARAKFAFPDGIAFTATGELLIGDSYNHRVRKIDANGFVSTIAGTDTLTASLYMPTDVATAGETVYIADSLNHRVRRLWPNRVVDTVATTDMTLGGVVETASDGGVLFTDDRFSWAYPGRTAALMKVLQDGRLAKAIDARIPRIGGLAMGPDGDVFVSDTNGHRILRFSADGTQSVVAGNGVPGFAGDGGPAYLAQVHTPRALAVGADGGLLIAEFGRVRFLGIDGRIQTVVNEHANGLALDRFGNVYLSAGRSIFTIGPRGEMIRIAGNDNAPAGPNEGGLASATRLNDPRGLAISANDEIYFADAGDNVVRRLIRNVPTNITVTGNGQTVAPGAQSPLISVQVTGRTGQPVSGLPVVIAFTSAPARPVSTFTTNDSGVVALRPNLLNRTGTVTLSATVPGFPPVVLTVRVE